MGASWSGIVTPTNDPNVNVKYAAAVAATGAHHTTTSLFNPHKLHHHHQHNSSAASGVTADPVSRSTMFAQHLHLMNTLTLKKLISSGTLSRPKKTSVKVDNHDVPVIFKTLQEEVRRDVVVASLPEKKTYPQLPRTTIVDVVEGKENAQKRDPTKDELPRLVKRTVLQASTSELLRCFGVFLHTRFRNLSGDFSPHDPMLWLRGLDRNLIAQGWQDIGFINPANIVFLYLLLRGLRMECAKSIRQLQAQVLTALYLSYSYMGHEISYPVKLFLYADDSKDDFWKRCLRLIDLHSEDMLRLNSDSAFFAKIFAELKSHGAAKPVQYHF